jgi:hypothetical protein
MAPKKAKSETDSARIDAEIAKLDGRGWSQWDIAQSVGMSQPMVSMRLKRMREAYNRKEAKEINGTRNQQLDQLRDVRREAWLAWNRSMSDAERQEFGPLKDLEGNLLGDEVLLKRVVEGRLPENAYLNTVMSTLKAERELLGLDAEKKNNAVTWDQVALIASGVREAIKRVLGSHPDLLRALNQEVVQLLPMQDATRHGEPLEAKVEDVG